LLNRIEERALVCSTCASRYPVEHGIPVVRESGDYYHELLPQERMRSLIARSAAMGWESAFAEEIANAPAGKRQTIYTVFADENRAAFKAILPSLQDKRVLDLGCGTGVTSIGLARWAREVVSCDLTLERVAFLSLRVRQMGITNVHPVCAGDTRPLPFPDRSFDCVILNGVLEWSAAEGERPVRDGQLEFLREIRRILTPGGSLYIGIENRYGYGYFFGSPEDHTGVKYAAIVPRRLADVLVKRANGHPYRTYTYSAAGLRPLLHEAGFPSSRFFAPIPDYRDFHELHALDLPASKPPASRGIRSAVKSRLERSRWFTPSFGVVASPTALEPSWVETLALELSERLQMDRSGRFPRVTVSGASSPSLIVTLDRTAIVRVPLDATSKARVERNFEGLERAQAIGLGSGVVAPRPLWRGEWNGIYCTAESFLAGTPLARLKDNRSNPIDQQALETLTRLRSAVDHAPRLESAVAIWLRQVVEPLRSVEQCLIDPDTRKSLGELIGVAERRLPEQLPVAFSHGDFWAGNILFHGRDAPLRIVDWDNWTESDVASNDVLHFLCYRRTLRQGSDWPEAFRTWLDNGSLDPVETTATARLARQYDLDRDWARWAALLYWAQQVGNQPRARLRMDLNWIRRVVGGTLPRLLEHLKPWAG